MQLCAVVNHALIVKRLPMTHSNFIDINRIRLKFLNKTISHTAKIRTPKL